MVLIILILVLTWLLGRGEFERVSPLAYAALQFFAQSHNHQKFFPQRRCMFGSIAHLPHAVSLANELYFLPKPMHN